MRRICVELGALGDVVVPDRKAHTFFRALPDEKYEFLKTALLRDRRRDVSASKFKGIAARATSYHTMQSREKVTAKDEVRHKARIMQAVTSAHIVKHGGSRNFRRNNVRGLGRGRRGNRDADSSARGNNNGGYTSTDLNGNPYDNSNTVVQVVDAKEAAATKFEEDEDVGKMTERTVTAVATYWRNSTEHGWRDCPLCFSHPQTDKTQRAS